MPASDFIQIVIKNDDFTTWQNYNDVNHRLAKGEPAAVWEVQLTPDGDIIYEADGITPASGKLLYFVLGDGVSTFVQLVPLWPVTKAAFNSIAANRAGTSRNMENITLTNATLTSETLDEALFAFFHPYAQPAFNAFNPSGYPDLEVGEMHDINGTVFSWSSVNSQNVKPGSVAITENFQGVDNTMISGLNGSGSYTASARAVRQGSTIDEQVRYTLSGRNTKEQVMAPVQRTRTWRGKRALFMHPDAEWLINGMTRVNGDPVSTQNVSDPDLAVLLNNILDNQGILGNGSFGLQSLDGGNAGRRAYALYPVAYKTTIIFNDPAFSQPIAPSVYRPITLIRHGVSVNYMLMALDLRIVQVATANVL